jgi:hypothetical protein
VLAAFLVGVATAIGYTFDRQIDLPNVSMIFIPVVLYSAIRHGLLPSLWATALSTLAYNFFFLEPLYTFTIRDPQNVVALLFLLLVAVIASQLLSPVLWDHYAMLLLLPVAWLCSRGHWWAVLIPLSTALPLVGVTPPIAYPIGFLVALVATLAVGAHARRTEAR